MIQMGTILEVADNSGAKKALCIKILGGTRKKFARVGDRIVISVRKAINSEKVKEGDVLYGIVIRAKKETSRIDGTVIKFFDNSIVLLNKQEELIGTRIFGVVPKEIKEANFSKITSLAQEVI